MIKKYSRQAISIFTAIVLIITQMVIINITAAEAPKQAPQLLFVDDFEHSNEPKVAFSSVLSAQMEADNIFVGIEEITDSETGEKNKVYKLSKQKNVSSGNMSVAIFPQDKNGNYAKANEGNSLETGKTYKYIVEYDYCLVEQTGSSGLYLQTMFSSYTTQWDTVWNNRKNLQGSIICNDHSYMQDIGEYSMFNLYAPTNYWGTAQNTTYYASGTGIADPSITLNIQFWNDFIGTVYIDNIRVYKVADGDSVGTVVFDAMDNSTTNYNAVTYVVGAEYKLPTPTKEKYDFVGWYTDKEYTEKIVDTVPENQINGKYTILYARWDDKTLVDDFDQASADDRKVSGGISVEDGVGIKNTSALMYSSTGAGTGKMIPMGVSGKSYKLKTDKNGTYNYIVEFDYKAENTISENGVNLFFNLVNASGNNAISNNQGEFNISPKIGNADGTWRTATFALRFTANTAADATISLNFSTADGAKVLIDNISLQYMPARIGSIVFDSDEYIGYIDPVAGEYGDLSGMENTAPVREGYTFIGWYSGESEVDITVFGDKDYTVTPKWQEFSVLENTTSLVADDFDQSAAEERNVYTGTDSGSSATVSYDIYNNFDAVTAVSAVDQWGYNTGANKASTVAAEDTSQFTIANDGDEHGNYLKLKSAKKTEAFQKYIKITNALDNDGLGTNGSYTKGSEKITVLIGFDYKAQGSYAAEVLLQNFNLRGECVWQNGVTESSKSVALKNYSTADVAGEYGTFRIITDGEWRHVSFVTEIVNNRDAWRKLNSIVFRFTASWTNFDLCIDNFGVKKVSSVENGANVILNSNGAEQQYDVMAGVVGEAMTLPTPTKSGYVFEGWYKGSEMTEAAGDKFVANTDTWKNTANSVSIYYAKWRERTPEDPLPVSVITELVQDKGTAGTTALKLSAPNGGKGGFNLRNAENAVVSKVYNENDKINWIVRLRYKGVNVGNGVNVDFDIAKAGTDTSLSKEGGTKISFAINSSNADGEWHTAYLPVALTRNELEAGVEAALLVKLTAISAFSELYFDEIEVFDAGDKAVSMYEFVSKTYIDPVAGVVGTKTVMPESPLARYSIGGWYKDEAYLNSYANAGESIAFAENNTKLYGEFLNYDGYFATETFDNTRDIYVSQMTSSDYNKYRWYRYGLYGKWRLFGITDEDCHDENGIGYSLKFDTRDPKYAGDPSATVLLTDGFEDQIKLGNEYDDPTKMYEISFWYKIVSADSDLSISAGAANYDYHWEGLRTVTETVQIPVMTTTNGEWKQMKLLVGLDGGANGKDMYARLSISGQGLVYIDDVSIKQYKSGEGQFIIFDTDGGNSILPFVGEKGTTIPELPTPVKENHIFKGWFSDYAYEKPFTSTTFGNETIWLNALWEEKSAGTGESGDTSEDIGDIILDDNSETDGEPAYYIEYDYEDILEEYEVEYNRKKTVMSKIPVTTKTGMAWWWILIIVISSVVVVGGITTFVIFTVKKKRKQ